MHELSINEAKRVGRKMKVHQGPRIADLPQLAGRTELQRDIRVVSSVLPFKINDYVIDQLIDWSRVPDDPIFRLTFPHRDMLAADDFEAVAALMDADAPASDVSAEVDKVRWRLNPHPSGQLEKNVPKLGSETLNGLQHKYRETVLYFPAQGQTCHSYCGYCFRWAQFVGIKELKQQSKDIETLLSYLRVAPTVTDVLITGGDPLIMKTAKLANILDSLVEAQLPNLQSIRLGTKALSFWPYRFLTDPDADDLLRLFERTVNAGVHVALMAHFSHPRELETKAVEEAIERIRSTGAVIRTQAPLVRHVNDDGAVWAEMWDKQVRLGCIPYYMFVERDTGSKQYFELPLVQAMRVYREAIDRCSGLARTARGPSMSASPGKVVVDGESVVAGERVLNLRFLQARNPHWVGRPFYAAYDPRATWLDGLRPAFGEEKFFFEMDPVDDWRKLEQSGEDLSRYVG